MPVGDYEQLEKNRAARAANERLYSELLVRREHYLRELLRRLPFRWRIAHAYTAQETGSYGGADHIVVDEPIRIGRLSREPGDALSRPRKKFWGLHDVEDRRLPTSLADIKIAERIVASAVEKPPPAKKTHARLDREITAALVRGPRR